MGKTTICIGENKAADQLCSNCTADQRLCFRYTDSTIPLLLKSEISSFYLDSVTVQTGLCRTWLGAQIVGFLMHRLKILLRNRALDPGGRGQGFESYFHTILVLSKIQ